jgi:hypothetical protein
MRTLNDAVAATHHALWADLTYRRLLDAVDDADALEGSLAADDFVAATMIRDYARRQGDDQLGGKKLAVVVKALHAVLRHYGLSREQRAATIGGEEMAAD